jgi:hypothetical protein
MDRPTPFYDVTLNRWLGDVVGYKHFFDDGLVRMTDGMEVRASDINHEAKAAFRSAQRFAVQMVGKMQWPDLQRILFDSRQAAYFIGQEEPLPDEMRSKLIAPFPRFWLEFNEPIALGENDDAFPNEFVRAILMHELEGDNLGKGYDGRHWNVQLFFQDVANPEPATYNDHAFTFDMKTGKGLTSLRTLANPFSRSAEFALSKESTLATAAEFAELEENWGNDEERDSYPALSWPRNPDQQQVEMVVSNGGSIANDILLEAGGHDGKVGRWERNVIRYAEFMSWVLTYMMAKGIEITPMRMSRAERRRLAKDKHHPQPWHVVNVSPRMLKDQGAEGDGRGVGFRFDVMSHIRFGRHKLADGSYRHTVEVVRAHQRGLRYTEYIPATRKFKAGKVFHPLMDEYMEGGGDETDGRAAS